MKKGIAFRRAKLAHIKRRRKHWWYDNMKPRTIGIAARTPKPCSCWLCGNARHHHGRTMQERRQLDSYALGIGELEANRARSPGEPAA